MAAYIGGQADAGSIRIVSQVSLTLTQDAGILHTAKVLNKLKRIVNTLGARKHVASAQAWYHVATGRKPEILRRSSFYKVIEVSKPPTQQLACLLMAYLGFRSGEVLASKHSHFDLDEGVVYVRDSKDKRLYPLPLPREVAYAYLQNGVGEGYVLKRHRRFKAYTGKPVTTMALNNMVKKWAYDAGIVNWKMFHPRLLRAFFAKEYVSPKERDGKLVKGSIGVLRFLMRHRDAFTTWIYLQQFMFLEDLQLEMERMYQPPAEFVKLENMEQ